MWSSNIKIYRIALGLLSTRSVLSLQIRLPQDAGIEYGRYPILNCGDNNHEIYKLLNTLNSTSLQTAIDDTRARNPSPAFKAFFKDASNAEFVRDVLVNVTQNANVPLTLNPPILPGPPIFICVTAEGQVKFQDGGGIRDPTAMRDAYTDCNQQISAATSLLGARIIIICPRFFEMPALPPPSSSAKSQCLTIDPSHDTRFIGEGESISRFQIWILLSMLVNLYIFRGVGTMLDSLAVNECLGLPASKTVMNSQNFVFYVSNIQLGCTSFPRRRIVVSPPTVHRIELLEVESNVTQPAVNSNGAENMTSSNSLYSLPFPYNSTSNP